MAPRAEPQFVCSKCDAQFLRWTGRCGECGAWSTIQEIGAASAESGRIETTDAKPGKTVTFQSLTETSNAPKQSIGFEPLDRVLGGGLVDGSVTLLSGEPGIGKSTLLAQAALAAAAGDPSILYVTGEESPSQVALRLKRLTGQIPSTLEFLDATDAAMISATIREQKPLLTIVDSVQSLFHPEIAGVAGSISQVKACAGLITEAAKRSNTSVILVGQVNKDGDIAGPRLLEHLVDTVLMLEGDQDHRFRILRVLKHRFGSTEEVSVLTMTEQGLSTVDDPSAELIKERPIQTSGSIITCLMEGHRPLLMEIQALVTPAGYGTPVRRCSGIDAGRLGLLIAVLARRAGINILDKDVYVNAAGGLKAKEPAMDLAICLAIASAVSDVAIDPKTAVFGEVGLGGEVRPASIPHLRMKECERHGFNRILVPKGSITDPTSQIVEVATLRDAIDQSLVSS
ncbi:DNA repair protein RadA [Candidatus Uhrbacteria bacterium]|nr:DNA repair protein RadA [Candidatus Uhrbacteria bacterium]MBD3284480.1 DNA repair protein RadA [Candidatus Uhrbacteria bacterium]